MFPPDGIHNPQGFLWIGMTPVILSVVPITSKLAAPGGVIQHILEFLLDFLPNSASIPKDRIIPIISAFYMFWTFAATGAGSVAGQAASRREGLDNKNPRAHIASLTGLPLRLRSAHYNSMEIFPSFALSAALSQSLAPTNQQIINLLALHALVKTFIYFPCYLLDIDLPRTIAHVVTLASVVNVAWLLGMGAR